MSPVSSLADNFWKIFEIRDVGYATFWDGPAPGPKAAPAVMGSFGRDVGEKRGVRDSDSFIGLIAPDDERAERGRTVSVFDIGAEF